MAEKVYRYSSVCSICGDTFGHANSRKIPVCKACRKKAANVRRHRPILTQICLHCGIAYLPSKNRISRQKYCSTRCRTRHLTAQGKGFRVNRKILYYKDCAYCGKPFGVTARDRATCCSRECGFQYATYLRFTNETWLEQRALVQARRKLLSILKALHTCGWCQRLYVAQSISSSFCSESCASYGYKRRSRERKIWIIGYDKCRMCHALFVTYKGRKIYCSLACRKKADNKRWQVWLIDYAYCQSCHALFVTAAWRNRTYCSLRCSKKAWNRSDIPARRRRRLTLRAQMRERFKKREIWERDGYVCQLCHKKTRPDYHSKHNLYPSIDHIIPVALGGYHERRNVQTAHRGCNSKKQALGTGDQLRLVG